jgi:DNA recombination protein RmuC
MVGVEDLVMPDILLVVAIIGIGIVIVLLIVLMIRRNPADLSPLNSRLDTMEKLQERTERAIREENSASREEATNQSRGLREEVGTTLKGVCDTLVKTLGEISESQRSQLEGFSAQLGKLTESNEQKLEGLKAALEQQLSKLQEDNAKKLEEMRKTVDEKLQGTLEKRLGESFKLVSDRLEQVYVGLGEMKALAAGVGDLKKVLTNVKVRGTWSEIQLGNLLEQVLSPDQYAANVATRKGSNERVEFAIKLPGRDGQGGQVVWLPVDAKFPKEDYERIIEASERADAEGVEEAGRQLEQRIKASAKDIRDKYLSPPETTDFGIMFLPSEGLYAEVLRRPGLVEMLQRDYRVNVAGPTTLAALLNSLQMGFRTLAIQQRSSEVWLLLGAVKTEFGKFGDVITKVQKKLQEATSVIDSAAVRTRAIERKLRDVEQLPGDDSQALLGSGEELENEGN